MGNPADLSREMVAESNDLSSGKSVAENKVIVKGGGSFSTILPLRKNDVYFLALVPEQQRSAGFRFRPTRNL